MTSLARPVIAETAIVASDAIVGPATKVWHFAQIRERARIGAECNVGKGVYIGAGVIVGNRCKIENNASLFEGLSVEDAVFIGPHVVFTNDRMPRAANPDGTLQTADDWTMGHTNVRRGASIGASAVIVPGVEIGRYSMIGAGAVVTHDVAAHALVVGNPARRIAWVCVCGAERTQTMPREGEEFRCVRCASRPAGADAARRTEGTTA